MVHNSSCKETDGNGVSVRVILFDYPKAFDVDPGRQVETSRRLQIKLQYH